MIREMSYTDAIEAGAIAIFEEKYGDEVRVISFGDFSTELCGGTHARATGDIGLLKVVSESGIAAGVRRIEALTGMGALDHMREQERTLRVLAELLEEVEESMRRRGPGSWCRSTTSRRPEGRNTRRISRRAARCSSMGRWCRTRVHSATSKEPSG